MARRSIATTTQVGASADDPVRRRFTVEEYYRMAETGILQPDERIELLDGEIYEMAPMGSPHAGTIRLLDRWFTTRLNDRAVVSVQCPLRLSNGSEPEPDLALLSARADDPAYSRSHPGPGDVLLLIEIADTSLRYDRDLKLPRYAEARVPEVWILDLSAKSVLVFRDPTPRGYRTAFEVRGTGRVAPAAFSDLELSAEELLS